MAYVPPHRRRQQQPAERGPSTKRGSPPSPNADRSSGTARSSTTSTASRQNLVHNHNDDALFVLEHAFDRICCINLDRRTDKWNLLQRDATKISPSFQQRIERVSAVDGTKLFRAIAAGEENTASTSSSSSSTDEAWNINVNINDVSLDWDGTTDAKYNRRGRPGPRSSTPSEAGCTLSHIQLWKQLVATDTLLLPHASASDRPERTMLILEDDSRFSQVRGRSRFAKAFANVWNILPDDWGFLYLGLSARGERLWLDEQVEEGSSSEKEGGSAHVATNKVTTPHDPLHNPHVRLYKPEYGYHTHAYAIRRQTAEILLQNLPVRGPIDVWLADNQWFSQPVYCAVVAGEGWQLEDGTYEGNDLVVQERRSIDNDIQHCS